MADILIKGMETPESCFECVLSHSFFRNLHCNELEGMSGFIGHLLHMNDRHPDCPLVPLPEGHGNLIDVDALEDMDFESCNKDDRHEIIWRIGGMNHIRKIIKDASIVVPAEGVNFNK